MPPSVDNEDDELRSTCSQPAHSLEDKICVLSARDKLMRKQLKSREDIENAEAVIGVCVDMCPEYERYCRIVRSLVSPLEMSDGEPDADKMVKEYTRPEAGQHQPLPHDLRPPSVLNRTMAYLLCNVMDMIESEDDSSPQVRDWFDFVWSRLRAIRKDITQQYLCDLDSVRLLETCARFHIFCAHRLCEQGAGVFDQKINDENLYKCIKSLREFYEDLALRNIRCPNETEFRCYEILLNLNDDYYLREVKHLSSPMRQSPQVQFAFQVHFALNSNNFVRFFALVRQTSYLNACILHRYFNQMRIQAVNLLKRTCTISNQRESFPKQQFVDQLCIEEEEVLQQFLEDVNLQSEGEYVILIKSDTNYSAMKNARSRLLIESKRQRRSVGEIVNGAPLPDNPFRKYPLDCSFDDFGHLKKKWMELIRLESKSSFAKSSSSSSSSFNAPAAAGGGGGLGGMGTSATTLKPGNVFARLGSSASSASLTSTSSITNTGLGGSNQLTSSSNSLFGPRSDITSNATTTTTSSTPSVFGKTSGGFSFTSSNDDAQQQNSSATNLFKKPPFHALTKDEKSAGNVFTSQFSFNKALESTTPSLTSLSTLESTTLSATSLPPMPPPRQPLLSEQELDQWCDFYMNHLIDLQCRERIKQFIKNLKLNQLAVLWTEQLCNEYTGKLVRQLATIEYDRERYELHCRQMKAKMVDELSLKTCNEWTQEVADRIIRQAAAIAYKQAVQERMEKFAISITKRILDRSTWRLCGQTLQECYERQRDRQEKCIQQMRTKRAWRLTRQCFCHWLKIYRRNKYSRKIRDTFPASSMRFGQLKKRRSLPMQEQMVMQSSNETNLISSSQLLSPFKKSTRTISLLEQSIAMQPADERRPLMIQEVSSSSSSTSTGGGSPEPDPVRQTLALAERRLAQRLNLKLDLLSNKLTRATCNGEMFNYFWDATSIMRKVQPIKFVSPNRSPGNESPLVESPTSDGPSSDILCVDLD